MFFLNTFIKLHAPLLWSNTTCADTFHVLQSASSVSVRGVCVWCMCECVCASVCVSVRAVCVCECVCV